MLAGARLAGFLALVGLALLALGWSAPGGLGAGPRGALGGFGVDCGMKTPIRAAEESVLRSS